MAFSAWDVNVSLHAWETVQGGVLKGEVGKPDSDLTGETILH